MPVFKATKEETRAWLGAGLIIPVPKVSAAPLPEEPEPEEGEGTSEQDEFDRRMAAQTPEQYRAMIKGLGGLARSKQPPVPGGA